MFKIPKQEYTAEFKELAVKRLKGQEIPDRKPPKFSKDK